jgi:dihydroorotate dehydrogenase
MAEIYPAVRSFFFKLDPEQAHALSLSMIRIAGALPPARALLRRIFAVSAHPVEAFNLKFSNPIGLAAGYDKDGLGWRGLVLLGFGHIEVGTVTLQPQPGNPQPRLFRLISDKALINRMGFPGKGAAFVAQQLKGPRPAGLVLGVNIGKNKSTPLEEAARDYLSLFELFAPLADYLAINVSSPNTEGLRRLQARQGLDQLLQALAEQRRQQEAVLQRSPPLLVKLAPDLTDSELDDALDVILANGMDGVIATNTTLNRESLSSPHAQQTGGLSGVPLHNLSVQMVRNISLRTEGRLPIIGVGGVNDASGARRMLDAGAQLVQVYTGMVYQGPALVKQIVRDI